MEDEPYLEQLIDALRQLREQVVEVRAGQQGEIESVAIRGKLSMMRLDAVVINTSLRNSRTSGAPDTLSPALQAISPDFSVEAIDNAIRIAESQRDGQ